MLPTSLISVRNFINLAQKYHVSQFSRLYRTRAMSSDVTSTDVTSSEVMNRLQQRAEMADRIVEDLRVKIQQIKDKYVESCAVGLDTRLVKENTLLKGEVARLKKELSFVEVRNGVPQIPMPDAPGAPTQEAPVSGAPKSEPGPAVKEGANSAPKEKKQKKKDGGEGKQAAPGGAGDEKPVDVSRLDIRVGLIEEVKRHPDADSLYVETVNVGDGRPRTIISGLVKHVPIEEMQDRRAMFILNLKAAKMRGILSEGMILCANSGDKVEIIQIPQTAVPGTRITYREFTGEPDALLAPKKKIWEQVMPDLKTNQEGVATYKGDPFLLNGEAVCRAPTCVNSQIK